MNQQEFYYTIDKPASAEFKDRGSRFIGYSFPLASKEAFKARLNEIKALHPKATHYCFGYRIGLTGLEFRVSDDGEPSGTAGKPILGQLDSRELTNALVIVVRYFGGSLLGVPGLINAYKTAASLALQVTTIVQKPVQVNYHLQFDYTQMNEIMTVIKQYNCSILSQETQLFCQMNIGVPVNRTEAFLNRVKELRGLDVNRIP